MSRSVAYLSGADAVAYLSGHELEDEWQWAEFKEEITSRLCALFPSLTECSNWDGQETEIFLANAHAEIGISEYNGLVSISLRAVEDDGYDNQFGLHAAWTERAADKFKSLGNLTKVGSFSNGEAVFKTTNQPNHTYSSKEGLCEWLEGDN